MKKSDSLRERAEKEIQKDKVNGYISESTDELVHELQVHQAELEIQNEELRDAQEELSNLYNQYHELYNEAPVGYFSLDRNGNIRNVNIKGSELLGLEKNRIIGFGFIRFIPLSYQTKYYNSLKNAIVMCKNQEVELKLKREKSLFYVQMEIMPIYDKPDEKYRIIITDITDRKKAEEAVVFQTQLLSQTHEAIFSLDANYLITYWNKAAEKTFGWRKEEVLGKNSRELLKTKFEGFSSDEIISNLWMEGSWEGEAQYLHKDGTYSFADVNANVLKDANGKSLGIIIAARDIKKRKKAEKLLKESEEKFSKAFYSNSAGMVIATLDGEIIEVNDAYANITGYKREELLGQKSTDLNILSVEAREEIVKRLFNGDSIFNEEFEIRTKTGEKEQILYTSEFIEFGGEKRAFTIIYDITERRKAEDALLERDKLMKMSQQIAHLGSWELDLVNDHLYWSDEVYRIFGLKPQEFGATYEAFLEAVHPDDRKAVDDAYFGSIRKGRDTYEIEHRVVRKSTGEIRFVHEKCEHFRDDSGQIIRSVGMVHDITERKKLEEELKKSRNNLELKVEERTAELDVLIGELKRSNAELQQFAYVSSHDLQEPLRTIASFTQLLERRYKGKFDSDADEFMNYIVEAAKRMQQLINDLLEYSRVTTKAKEFKPADVNRVLDKALFNLKASTKECNAEITHDKLPTVMADKTQLVQLFQNLIGNSIKFKKPDKPAKIHISATKDEEKGEYLFSVKDNGIGMEPQYAERIFIIFQRLHTREKYKGTGIGLSISKKIIERHGGHIWVESEYGVGSTFYFTIPIKN